MTTSVCKSLICPPRCATERVALMMPKVAWTVRPTPQRQCQMADRHLRLPSIVEAAKARYSLPESPSGIGMDRGRASGSGVCPSQPDAQIILAM